MKLIIIVLFTFLISSCASTEGSWSRNNNCTAGKLDSNGYPCWVNKKPLDGVVLSMSEHVDPNKTRETLFKKALLEIAAGETGLEISEDSIVKKQTRVTGSDNVSQQSKVITLATVKTANGSVMVKAKIKDEWKHPSSRKLFLWVVPTN